MHGRVSVGAVSYPESVSLIAGTQLSDGESVALSAAQLERELDTDWFPDPWRWALLELAREGDSCSSMAVPFPGGVVRRVPVLTAWERAELARLALRVVGRAQRYLASGVFGFRVGSDGLFQHYRPELRRRADFEIAAMDSHPFVSFTDVQSFFPSIRLEQIEASLSVGSEPDDVARLSKLLGRFRARNGYPLPEGHAATRALASLVLMPVDASINAKFARWLDDYKVFTADRKQAETALASLVEAIHEYGLHSSPEKTGLASSGATWSYAASLADHEDDGSLNLESAMEPGESGWSNEGEKRLRLALRHAAESQDRGEIRSLVDAALDLPPIAYPRLAWAMWRHREDERVWSLVIDLLQLSDDFDEWRRLRILPLLWYLPRHVSKAVEPTLVECLSSPSPVRLIAARVAAKWNPELAASALSALSERERTLVEMEIRSFASCGSRESGFFDDAVSAGPPIQSFL